ncbi:MAG: hypothetical protein ABR503_15045, partial [Chitinophagaceae bacterium]
LFFALGNKEIAITETPLSKKERVEIKADIEKELKERPEDSSLIFQLAVLEDETKPAYLSKLDTSQKMKFTLGKSDFYKSTREYDSVQRTRPEEKRDNWLERIITRKGIEINQKYKSNIRAGANILLNDFLHKLPYMLFISLPLFALILKLLYIRHKNFYYSDHTIFTLFHYILSFMLL